MFFGIFPYKMPEGCVFLSFSKYHITSQGKKSMVPGDKFSKRNMNKKRDSFEAVTVKKFQNLAASIHDIFLI